MNNTFEKNLHFRIVKYGSETNEVFTFDEMSLALNLTDVEQKFVAINLVCVSGRDTNSYVLALEEPIPETYRNSALSFIRKTKCRLTSAAIFEYIDYLEIKAAREAAKESKRLSWIAIIISSALALAQIFSN